MSVPVRGVAYTFTFELVDALNPDKFLIDPTIAAGDFRISKDFGAFTNLATTPVVSPAGSTQVRGDLSATEMTADDIKIQGIDAAGAEWQDVAINIDVPSSSIETVGDIQIGIFAPEGTDHIWFVEILHNNDLRPLDAGDVPQVFNRGLGIGGAVIRATRFDH